MRRKGGKVARRPKHLPDFAKLVLRTFTVTLLVGSGAVLSAKDTVIRAAQLIDGNGGPPLRPGMVIIRNDRIQAAGRQLSVPANATVYDLGGATILPGLI